MKRQIALAAACLVFAGGAGPDNASLEQRFDAGIRPNEMADWIKLMAAEPNHVGSPHDKANAEWEAAQFRSFGWDARIETFQVLYPTPVSEKIDLLGAKPYHVKLQEPPIPGDTTARSKQPSLPAYLEYQGDGDVTAPLVYVNYGMRDDYKALQRLGVDVKGKIVIARYGGGWRGLKPLLAQQHGAAGCLIYSDPSDDGYSVDATYPNGPARPPHGFQRGSVADMPIYPGDPLTPGVGSTQDAKRLKVEEAPTITKIPVLPISYADAQPLLAALTGRVAPEGWRGGLSITYHLGPGPAKVHLKVKSNWDIKPLYDVIGKIPGSTFPDDGVIRGNHHDAWVNGAEDPISGQIAILEEARSLGELVKSGWKP